MTGNANDAVTRQRNTQVHVLQNFAAGFRCQATTTTGSASIVGVLHSQCSRRFVSLGIGSKQGDGVARRTGVIVPASGNPSLFGRQWL